ncbi:hypothetical protein GCK72_020211 [Caenorhabditis remanei]|uniref:Uncharacterized protein n=1 Tax=Caenorhabditis remanei TaxID=31234 RepID=A0A6A5GFX4_CAERE|nr:hypothetical protein GCK72_020211 [Caenorhabditis remanei]KAF1753654.1 hypothetical protein GCK72_020211 [Caenorhabditis remanei]
MASQLARQTHAYLPIDWFPEYQTFSYHFDYVTVIIILSLICFIPSVFATVRMILFYLKTSTRNRSKVIHPYVFKSFLCMQSCNIIATVIDFIVYRVPYTTLVTSYFATIKSEIIIRYLVAALYAFNYMSQLYTVLFCFIRVLVLFNPRTHSERLQNIGDAVFSSIVTFCIVTMTSVMIFKVKTLKLVGQHSKLKAKAETTLKITMCIILIPSIMTQIFTVICFYATTYASYIILVRPVLLDCRVSIVSCYFYWTHPYFKQTLTPKPLSVKSLSTS